jgi:hypothetical protein
MASEKKPSIYFDRGTIGSAEELDEYGVWVKSEPQDLPSAAADDIFDDPSLAYMRETPDFGDESYIEDIPVPDMSDSDDGFDAEGGFGPEVHAGEGGQQGASAEMSTQLLMKIAEELSSIRSELTTLKNEFAGVRSDAGADYKPDAPHSGFFAEEDDEKIALTGDEMYNILNAADFSEAETLSIDPLQSFDDGMLDMLSGEEDITHIDLSEPVASSENDDEEEIEIDLTDLGINLDEIEANEEANAMDLSPQPVMDDSFNANFDILPEDNVPDGEIFATGDSFTQNSEDESLEETEIESFDGLDELQHISLDDEPLIAAHEEDTSYLEEDPLAMQETELDDLAETENALDISLDAVDLDLNIDEPLEENPVSLEDTEEPFDASSLDFSEAIIDEPDLSAGITESPEQEPVLDDISDEDAADEDISIELEEKYEFESPIEENPAAEEKNDSIEEKDDSIAQVIPEGFEIVAEEAPVPFDDDLETLTEEDLVGPEDLSENVQEENPAPEAVKEDEADDDEPLAEEPLSIPSGLKSELKNVLSYMDHLLESLPEEKIEEFAKSEYFDSYKKLFKELGLV